MPLTELVRVQAARLPRELAMDAVEGKQQQLTLAPGGTVGEWNGRVVHDRSVGVERLIARGPRSVLGAAGQQPVKV